MRKLLKPWTWLDEEIHDVTLDRVKSLSYKMDSLTKQLSKMQETYETLVKEQAKNSAALEAQLKQKTQFIENLFSNMLVSKLSNGHAEPNGKGGDMIDLSLLDTATQTIVKNKLKNLATAKRLP